MLKTSILIIFGFVCATSIAQNFGGGIILGVSSSQVGGDNLGGFDKAGLLIGAFTNKLISESISLQLEMNFIMKGSNNAEMSNTQHKDFAREDISLSYLELPLLVKYHQSSLLDIEAGMLFAYLIKGYYNDLNGRIPYNNTNPFIKYDIGALLGLSYKYSKKINFNTRISNSILPIGEEDYTGNKGNPYRKGKYNSVLSFAIHYNI